MFHIFILPFVVYWLKIASTSAIISIILIFLVTHTNSQFKLDFWCSNFENNKMKVLLLLFKIARLHFIFWNIKIQSIISCCRGISVYFCLRSSTLSPSFYSCHFKSVIPGDQRPRHVICILYTLEWPTNVFRSILPTGWRNAVVGYYSILFFMTNFTNFLKKLWLYWMMVVSII